MSINDAIAGWQNILLESPNGISPIGAYKPPVPLNWLPGGWHENPGALPIAQILRGELSPDWWIGTEWDKGQYTTPTQAREIAAWRQTGNFTPAGSMSGTPNAQLPVDQGPVPDDRLGSPLPDRTGSGPRIDPITGLPTDYISTPRDPTNSGRLLETVSGDNGVSIVTDRLNSPLPDRTTLSTTGGDGGAIRIDPRTGQPIDMTPRGPNDPDRGNTGGTHTLPDWLIDRINSPLDRPFFNSGPDITSSNPNGIPLNGGTGGVNGGGLPIGELPGPLQGGQFATYAYQRGPNGEFLPAQTGMGGSPYQLGGAQIPGQSAPNPGAPFGVTTPDFGANQPQQQWFTMPPLQPQPLGNPVGGTGPGGNGGPIGNNGGNNGGHNTMPSAPGGGGGLLSMPPSINPATGLLLGGSSLPPSLTGLLR